MEDKQRLRTEYMTKQSRKKQEWIRGREFPQAHLRAAQRDCCYRCLAGAVITRVVDSVGDHIYTLGNPITAIYDLAVWDGYVTDPGDYAEEMISEEIWISRRES